MYFGKERDEERERGTEKARSILLIIDEIREGGMNISDEAKYD
jgi:hypothetical protein